jgi:hypothetical protein
MNYRFLEKEVIGKNDIWKMFIGFGVNNIVKNENRKYALFASKEVALNYSPVPVSSSSCKVSFRLTR